MKALQLQLEKALISQVDVNPPSSTVTAILETKDARISTLEDAVRLLEEELDELTRKESLTSPLLDLGSGHLMKHQVSEGDPNSHVPCLTEVPSSFHDYLLKKYSNIDFPS